MVSVGETAASVRRTFHTTQGWRPTSAVHQPAIVATRQEHRRDADPQQPTRHAFPLAAPTTTTTPISGNRNPRSIRWYAWNARLTGAQSSFGNFSMPDGRVEAPVREEASRHGTPMA